MKRLAYALGFLGLMAVLATGILGGPGRSSGENMLVSAVQAMEEADTVHVVGRPNQASPEGYPWGQVSEGHYETWYTPRGYRMDYWNGAGDLVCSLGTDFEAGLKWVYGWYDPWFKSTAFRVYRVDKEALEREVAASRESLTSGDVYFNVHGGEIVATRKEVVNGKPVTVVVLERKMPNGEPLGTTEGYIDSSGRLIGMRGYGPEDYGKPLVGEIECVEYDVTPPVGLFGISPPKEAPLIWDFAEPYPGAAEIDVFGASFGLRYRIEPSPGWRVSAGPGTGDPSAVIDGDYGTAWTAAGAAHLQEPGTQIEVAFETPLKANKMLVHSSWDGWAEMLSAPEAESDSEAAAEEASGDGAGAREPSVDDKSAGTGWPRSAQVFITEDGVNWSAVVTGPAASDRPLYANFGALRLVRGVRVVITGPGDEERWTVREIDLFGPPR